MQVALITQMKPYLLRTEVYSKVLEVLAPRYKERPGGFTRMLRIGARKGDATEVAMMKLVD